MQSRGIVLVALVMAAGCGGGDGGEPLLGGSLTGDYAGDAFTPTSGFATTYNGSTIIGVGDGDIGCDSPEDDEPPPGTNALLSVPSFEVGTYSGVFVNLYHNVDDFEGVGTNSGTVTITAASADSIAGMVSFAYTDDENVSYSLEGTFEVIRCAE